MAKRQQTFKRAASKRKAKQRARRTEDKRRAATDAEREAGKGASKKPEPEQG